jgi:hypothetical protein
LKLATGDFAQYYLVSKQEAKDGDTYTLTRTAFDAAGRSFALTYKVFFFRHGGPGSCDCPDAAYRGSRRPCKHAAALAVLRSRGLV